MSMYLCRFISFYFVLPLFLKPFLVGLLLCTLYLVLCGFLVLHGSLQHLLCIFLAHLVGLWLLLFLLVVLLLLLLLFLLVLLILLVLSVLVLLLILIVASSLIVLQLLETQSIVVTRFIVSGIVA